MVSVSVPMRILYEDNHLIAVEKPHGQLTQADESGDVSLLDEVKAFIKTRDQKPGNVFLGLLHRLDRPVGGVVLFAKTSKAASRLSEQFRSRKVQKVYEALVEGVPGNRRGYHAPLEGTVVQWLVKDTEKNIVTAYDHEVPGSQKAELDYRVIEEGKQSRVEIHPKTGRPHQIRVAMASLGTPIVGDFKYGAKTSFNGQVALKAVSLTIEHPITKESLTISLPK